MRRPTTGTWWRRRANGCARRPASANSLPWVEASLERQLELFTPWGMYRDPNDPMAYDHFARLWALDLLDEGYRGRHAGVLEELLERGCWMSLFMQSPSGELPCGGRSAHHQWNEAQQAVTFESWASRFARRGDKAAAGACKRGAQPIAALDRAVAPTVGRPLDRQEPHGPGGAARLRVVLVPLAVQPADRRDAGHRLDARRRPHRLGVVPGRRRRRYAFALQPAFHKVFVKPGGMLPRDRHRRRPATTTRRAYCACTIAACRPRRSRTASAQRRPTSCRRSRRDSLALGPEWRDRAGAGMPSPTTAGTTSSQPSSRSSGRRRRGWSCS